MGLSHFGYRKAMRMPMFKRSSLRSAVLIASLATGSTISALSADNANIPNSASADFGWLLQGGIDYRPIPGRVPPITFDPAYPQKPGNQRGVMERMSDAENPKSEALGAGTDAQVQSRCAQRPPGFHRPSPLLAWWHTGPIAFPG